MVVIGHVDAGKSTLMGHLLYLIGKVDQKVVHKYQKESKEQGKASFHFAWVMDEHAEERQRGITINVGVHQFLTEHRQVTLLDAPGHRDFVPNMISGAAQADVALLVIDARTGAFESGFEADGQTKEHALLARSLGVMQLGVVINKMDSVQWSRERYEQIETALTGFLRNSAGFRAEQLFFVPCAGLTGENLVVPLAKTAGDSATALAARQAAACWYQGPSLLQCIDQFKPLQRDVQKPFRMAISDVYKTRNQSGITLAGRIEAGFVSPGHSLLVLPVNDLVQVKTVRSTAGEQLAYGFAGDNVDLVVLSSQESPVFSAGDLLCDPERPARLSRRFQAQIVTFALSRPITVGQTVELHLQANNVPAVISSLLSLLNKSTGEVQRRNPRLLLDNQTALVEIACKQAICVERYADYKQLGRFTLREQGRTIAAGLVTELLS